jgi:hypothetical protein
VSNGIFLGDHCSSSAREHVPKPIDPITSTSVRPSKRGAIHDEFWNVARNDYVTCILRPEEIRV